MLSLLLFLLTLLISAIAVRIGAIALELTGLTAEQAAFQSLSAFSGVGYTTQEAEFTLNHPQRRRIIQWLIYLGSAGLLTTVATLIGTLASSRDIVQLFSEGHPITLFGVTLEHSELLLLGALIGGLMLLRFLSQPAVARLLKELATQFLLQSHWVEPVQYKEYMTQANGNGVIQVDICERNPQLGQSPTSTVLRDNNIQVLSIERLNAPPPPINDTTRLEEGDRVVYYGPIVAISKLCCEPDVQPFHKLSKAELADAPLPLDTMAPGFHLKNQFGDWVDLSDFKNHRHLVIVFYPKDQSFICSAQLRRLGEHQADFDALNTTILAINQESETSHGKFAECLSVGFSILSDPKKTVCKAYRALMLGGLLVNRTVYIIDDRGFIRYAKRGDPSLAELLGTLRALPERQPLVS
jgi:peroxiredoxin